MSILEKYAELKRTQPLLRVLLTLLQWSVPIAICAVIVRNLGWSKIVAAIAQADHRWLILALALFVVSIVIGTVQWQLLLFNKGIRMSFFKAFRIYCVGMFFNNFILGIAGDAMRVAYIKSEAGQGKAGLAATFLDRFLGLWAMIGFALGGSIALLKAGALSDHNLLTASVAFLATFVLFAGICAFIISGRTQRLVMRILDAMPLPKKRQIKEVLQQIAMEAHNRHVLIPIALLSILVQFMRVTVHIACGASLGLLTTHNIQYFFVFVPIIAIIMLAPMPFGIKEGLEGSLFYLAGFSPLAPQAPIVMGFLASIVGIAASLMGGVFFIFMRIRLPLRPTADISSTADERLVP
jgi:uncharacterized protein (TIRG00374 family)